MIEDELRTLKRQSKRWSQGHCLHGVINTAEQILHSHLPTVWFELYFSCGVILLKFCTRHLSLRKDESCGQIVQFIQFREMLLYRLENVFLNFGLFFHEEISGDITSDG